MRLEGVAKAGYYPTPPSVVERIAALIRPASPSSRQAVRLLDPCCGTGAALCQLADTVGGETYGVESAQTGGRLPGDPDVEIEREVLRTSVVALDLRPGRFEVIEH